MPKLLRTFLGVTLLITTIGLVTCQSMVKAEPPASITTVTDTSPLLIQADSGL